MGLIVFHIIFPDNSDIQTICEKYLGVLCGILSVPQNIVMALIIIMLVHRNAMAFKWMKQHHVDGIKLNREIDK
jgi:hypothetical protein